MKTLYLDCGMGAAGDMLGAALLELLSKEERAAFVAEVNALGIPGVCVEAEPAEKCGIRGTHMRVTVNGEEEHSHDHHEHHHHHDEEEHGHHHHSGMHDIEHIVCGHTRLPEKVKKDVMEVFGLIAEAESHAHGMPVDQIHFHEVGTMDAVADIAMVCLLMDRIRPDRVVASPVHVGSGKVRCAHGILPVPAPATAYILKDVPMYGGQIEGELCTPTGAALLKHFVTGFGPMPVMKAQAVGYGMGQKDFAAANCVRAILGEDGAGADEVTELACNVDDMTAEEIGFAMETLLEAGALDVWTQAIGMKKSRPGTMICVLCREEKQEELTGLLFKTTSTIGVRRTRCERAVLDRESAEVETPYGTVHVKRVNGYGVSREKAEYEDLAALARKQGLGLAQMRELLKK